MLNLLNMLNFRERFLHVRRVALGHGDPLRQIPARVRRSRRHLSQRIRVVTRAFFALAPHVRFEPGSLRDDRDVNGQCLGGNWVFIIGYLGR